MPRLTDTVIKQAKPKAKQYKLFDEAGLFLIISKSGGKWWRFKYRFGSKEKLLSLGTYPDISLKQARIKRDEARELVANDIDPSFARKASKAAKAGSFKLVGEEWLAKNKPVWVESHSSKIARRLEKDIYPYIGSRPINEVSAPELLEAIRRIESRGAIETAHRALQNCGQIFRYAIATGRAERNIAADLRGALQPSKEKHHSSITDPKQIGELLRVIEGYEGDHITRCALKLAPLLFVRPGELRHAEWNEIDLELSEWVIPAEKMKMRVKHIVPLSRQAIEILSELQQLTGQGKYVFPGVRSAARPMSENTVTAALRRMGYTKDQMTGHGFRSMASTRLNESQKWHYDSIERQLAHSERNNVRAAYNYAEHLPERVNMMQWWSDYLDELKQGAQVIPLRA